MLDLKAIRATPDVLDKALQNRGGNPISQILLKVDEQHRHFLTELQSLQNQRHKIAKKFGEAKKAGQETDSLGHEAEQIKSKIMEMEIKCQELSQQLHEKLILLPNIPDSHVPYGRDETMNVELRRQGFPKSFDFPIKPHFELGEDLKLMDFEKATKIAGSRFNILYGDLAKLERALAAFMIDIHTQKFGYREVSPPLLANEKSVYGAGLLPKFKQDLFQTTTGYWLIPTAEVVLSNLVADTILDYEDLPLRYTAYTPCFRSEAGASGKDTKGMIRQHQFGKVELVSITHPDHSSSEHERMTSAAETILRELNLPYRVILLCTGDMGFQSQKTYDLEVWIPSQNTYREISSCSNCGAFQARRMNARYRGPSSPGHSSLDFVHTLNGSGLAVGRTIVALLENYQTKEGNILIPDVLRPYMSGIEMIYKQS